MKLITTKGYLTSLISEDIQVKITVEASPESDTDYIPMLTLQT